MTGEGGSSVDHSLLGRFDRSFFVRMTTSFLVLAAAVAVMELAIRWAVLRWDFRSEGEQTVRVAADRLAADVSTIMLNSGGPVASRAVYPILARSFDRAGLHIAIEPTPVTVSSIEKTFGFRPRGIPAVWPEGAHHEARVELRAEEFCLRCHGDASVGDVLGTVTVRDYLDERVAGWWEEVRLTVTLNLLKVVVHTVILFFLLRSLMEPLLGLRSAVSRLAKGAAGLSTRAEVRSTDEFGSLAHDLNAFLDRMNHILHDLRGTLDKMATGSTRLATVTGQTRTQLGSLEEAIYDTVPREDEPVGSAARTARLDAALPRLVHEARDLRHMVEEMAYVEAHLNDVADQGRQLCHRLIDEDEGSGLAG